MAPTTSLVYQYWSDMDWRALYKHIKRNGESDWNMDGTVQTSQSFEDGTLPFRWIRDGENLYNLFLCVILEDEDSSPKFQKFLYYMVDRFWDTLDHDKMDTVIKHWQGRVQRAQNEQESMECDEIVKNLM